MPGPRYFMEFDPAGEASVRLVDLEHFYPWGGGGPDLKITAIYRGIIPFLVAPLILIVLMFLFPQLALWLPKLLYG